MEGEHISLAQAVLSAGRALFPNEWHDTDPEDYFTLTFFNPSPGTVPDATIGETVGAESFALQVQQFEAEKALAFSYVVRFAEVRKWLVERLSDGRITGGLLDQRDSSIRLLNVNQWVKPAKLIEMLFETCEWFDGISRGHIFINFLQLSRELGVSDAEVEFEISGAKRMSQDGVQSRLKPRGRTKGSTKYDWPSFLREAVKRLGFHGGINLLDDPTFNKAALERQMAEWCQTAGWPSVPSESRIRDYVVEAVKAYEAEKLRAPK